MNEPIIEVRDFLRTRLVDPVPGVFPYIFTTTFGNGINDRDTVNWVYTWFPRFTLTSDSFPIISITQLNESGDVFGLGSTTHWQTFQMQIDIWGKDDKPLTMDNVAREGKEIVFLLARRVQEAFRQHWITDFANEGKFKLYRITGKKPVVYDFEKRLWRITLTIELEVDISNDWI